MLRAHVLAIAVLSACGYADPPTYATAIEDAREIKAEVDAARPTLARAQRLTAQASRSAAGGPGRDPSVDYSAIEQLQALEQPFNAHAFSSRFYSALGPAIVTDLFQYYMAVLRIWDQIERLAANTLPEAQRADLERATQSQSDSATPIACVLVSRDDQVFCGLAYAAEVEEDARRMSVRASRPGRSVDVAIWNGEDITVGERPEYGVIVHPVMSTGVLGERGGPFAAYVRDLAALQQEIERTVEVEGRLVHAMGEALRQAGVGSPGTELEFAL